MLGKTKNFLFNLCKKKTILFVFFFSFFGLTLARSASAGWVWDMILGIPSRSILLIFWVLARLAILTVKLAGIFLNWVLSHNFISLSYTNPANNEIIKTGLGVTQGFVNMLLVLILVYIAIATILRLAGYETKKLLITFIIVALLVNFAPVICGIIVDASNIVMNFFIQDIKADAFGKNMASQVNNLLSGFEWASLEIDTALPRAFQMMIMAGFLFVLSFILNLFAILFILRHLVIWLLVILSPLAFACYILPMTRKYFDKWWEQFINWSFIGVSCGFFLYLGLLLVTKIPASIPAPQTGETPIFNNILPYFVSAIFLGIGFVFGLQTSAIGASTAIAVVKRGQKATTRTGGWVARTAWRRGIRPNIDRTLYRATEKIRGKGKGITTRTIGAGIAKQWGKTPVARWFLPEPLRKYGQYRPALLAAAKEAESYDSRTLMDRVYTLADKEEIAAGNAYSVLDRVDSQDVFDAGKRAFGKDLSDDELIQNKEFGEITGRFLQIGRQSGMLGGGFTRKDPRLAIVAAMKGIKGYGDIKDAAGNALQGEDLIRAAVRKAVGEARQHIAKWEPETLKNKYVMEAMLGLFDRDRWLQVNRQVKRGQDSALNGMDSLFSDYIDEHKLPYRTETEKGKASEGFKEHIKKLNKGFEGYAKAVVDKRMQQTGWRETEYIPKKERWQGKVGAVTTPGKAVMGRVEKEVKAVRRMGEGGKKEVQGRRPGGLMPDRKKPPKGRRV